MARKRKRLQTRTIHVDWCPSIAAIFDLAGRFGLQAPARVTVVLGRGRSTWSARFLDDGGQPVNAVVRFKHLADGSHEVTSDKIHMRFVSTATGAQLLGEVA